MTITLKLRRFHRLFLSLIEKDRIINDRLT